MTRLRYRRAPIPLANEVVPIATVCAMLGVDLPGDYGRPAKVRCPFGAFYHSDQGHAPAMRVYFDSNHAWCFACGAYYTPVKLAAQGWDCDWRSAALRLLEIVGHRPVDLATAFSHAASAQAGPQPTQLAQALSTYCRRIAPDWAEVQFTPGVAATLDRCLSLLELVQSDTDAIQWLQGCKTAMGRALRRQAMSQPCPDAVDSW